MKKFLALFLTLALMSSMAMTAFASEMTISDGKATEQGVEVQPRIGYAGHGSGYHNGSTIAGSFTLPVKTVILPMNQWTVKTSGFPSNATIVVDLFYNGKQANQQSITITGNNERKNQPLVPGGIVTGNYTVKYDVWTGLDSSAAGTIEVWVY